MVNSNHQRLYVDTVGQQIFNSFDTVQRNVTVAYYPAQWVVHAVTWNKALAASKLRYYANARQLGATAGTAATAALRPAHPLQIGRTVSLSGGASSYWQGRVGPVIVAATELATAQIGGITTQLLALRRAQEAL